MANEILECGHSPSEHSLDFTTGYGVNTAGSRLCYYCIAIRDEQDMVQDGDSSSMYMIVNELGYYEVTNWPGSLRFHVISHTQTPRGPYGNRYEAGWFRGPEGRPWIAEVRGDMDLAKARRLKRFPRHLARFN